jgi:hydrogenase maturation factor
MSPTSDSVERRDEACAVCGDVAVPGRVLTVDASARTATVELECRTETVAIDLVEANVGDTLLVHLGFAIARLEVA